MGQANSTMDEEEDARWRVKPQCFTSGRTLKFIGKILVSNFVILIAFANLIKYIDGQFGILIAFYDPIPRPTRSFRTGGEDGKIPSERFPLKRG